MPRPSALVFVYNTNGGVLNSVVDLFRGLFAPKSYPCNLCRLTYAGLGMNKRWWEHLKGLGLPLVFLHRNELKKKYGISNADLPAVFKPAGDRLTLLIDADEINRCKDLDSLIRLLDRNLA